MIYSLHIFVVFIYVFGNIYDFQAKRINVQICVHFWVASVFFPPLSFVSSRVKEFLDVLPSTDDACVIFYCIKDAFMFHFVRIRNSLILVRRKFIAKASCFHVCDFTKVQYPQFDKTKMPSRYYFHFNCLNLLLLIWILSFFLDVSSW